jgi:hypothetical protein
MSVAPRADEKPPLVTASTDGVKASAIKRPTANIFPVRSFMVSFGKGAALVFA